MAERVYLSTHLTSYLPYKVHTVLVTTGVVRGDMNVIFTFVLISFFNRCLNPFIYASQYEAVRRTWAPLVELLRRRVVRKPPASAAARIEPLPVPLSSSLSHPAKGPGPPLSVSITTVA